MENNIVATAGITKKWLVIYTQRNWEKKIDQTLKKQGIMSYCPVKTVSRQWADRKKTLEIPLFSSYLFVKINLKEELLVRQTLGVINFIYYMGKPATIRETEIEKIQELINKNPDSEIIGLDEIFVGDKVTIKNGILSNQMGRIIKIKGKTVLMAFENLSCALVASVKTSDLALSF